MAESKEPIVQFVGVSKAFGTNVVLEGLSLDIERGQTTVIIGPSGTGKSVFLKLLVGLLEPDEGAIWVDGIDVAQAGEVEIYSMRKKLGMLFQDGALFDSMTVGDNIGFPLRRHSDKSDEEIAETVAYRLQQVGLPGIEDQMPASLSGGMRKRVSLARAIVMEPDIVLFDEPNSGLDPIMSDEIDALIGRMKEELGITFVVISHDIVGTFHVADVVAMLYNGRLLAHGPPGEVLASSDPMVRRFLARNMRLPPLSPEESP